MAISDSSKRRHDRPVGAAEHLVGVGILSVVALMCTTLLIRGLAPRGTLWGAAQPLVVGDGGAIEGASVSFGSISRAAPGAKPAAAGLKPGAPTAALPGQPGALPAASGPAATGAPTAAGPAAATGTAAATPAAAAAGGSEPHGPQDFLPVDGPAGFKPSKVERFTKDTVYIKIDGREQAYHDYGFVGLEIMSFTQGEQNIDVEIFDQATPLQAFGIYGTERNPGDAVSIGNDGYKVQGSVFFQCDRWYVRVVANQPTLGEQSMALAQAVAKKMPASRFDPPGAAWFPKDGLQPRTLKYTMRKLGAAEGVDDGWGAGYAVGDAKVDAFFIRRDDPAQLAPVLANYQKAMQANGKITELTIAGTKVWVIGADSGPCDMWFQKGNFLGGVMYVQAGRKVAETITTRLIGAAGG